MSSFKTTISVRSSFVGFHSWPDAPDEVAFLRNVHRHVFHVLATFNVSHGDRQLEFFIMQRKLNTLLKDFEDQTFNYSCEHIASALLQAFLNNDYNVVEVTVSEDNENHATIRKQD